MKEKIISQISRGLNYFIPVIVILFIYEYFFAKSFSFSSALIDSFFWYTSFTVFLSILFFILLKIILDIKKKFIKGLAIGFIIPISLLLLIVATFNFITVENVSRTHKKYYFYKDKEYSYYMVSERFFALDGLELRIYKEKPIFSFINERTYADESKLVAEGVDIQKAREIFIKKYFP